MINKYKSIIIISIISFLIIIFTFTGITNKLLSIFSSVSFGKATNIDDKLSQEQLEAKVISLEAEVASLLYLKSENELLKSAIQTKNETGITPIQVKIIAFDNDFTRSSALVEVGSNDGVKINQPVIYLGHLVGKVKEVSDSYSTIQFLNDTELKLAVTIQNSSSSQGVLKSEFGTVLEVDAVSKLESVSVENNIITLANENIPAGLLVGKVKLVTEGDLFHKIIVDYPIDFYKLTDVFILKT
jgi:rod shape-determining protein MreC